MRNVKYLSNCFECANFDEGEGQCRFYSLPRSFDMNDDCGEYEPRNADKEAADDADSD